MSIEVMKQALEALEECMGWTHSDLTEQAADALRQAIEQAEKVEPVAELNRWLSGPDLGAPERVIYSVKVLDLGRALPMGKHSLYAAPTAPAQPLTDDDIERIALAADMPCDHMPDDYCDSIGLERGARSYGDVDYPQLVAFARAIEAHIKGASL